jgi:hypothetical protein
LISSIEPITFNKSFLTFVVPSLNFIFNSTGPVLFDNTALNFLVFFLFPSSTIDFTVSLGRIVSGCGKIEGFCSFTYFKRIIGLLYNGPSVFKSVVTTPCSIICER